MTIETASYINQLNTAYPRSTDLLKEGDDHIRMIKNTLKYTFPRIDKAIKISADTLNNIDTNIVATNTSITIQGDLKVSAGKNIDVTGTNLNAGAVFANNGFTVGYANSNNQAIIRYKSGDQEYNNALVVEDIGYGATWTIKSNYTPAVTAINFNNLNINTSGGIGIIGNSRQNLGHQGMHLGWNEGGDGRGNINVNQGGGVGGLTFRFVNGNNSNQTGSITFNGAGGIGCGTINSGSQDVNGDERVRGTLYVGQPGNNDASYQADGNIYNRSGGSIFGAFGNAVDLNGALHWMWDNANNNANNQANDRFHAARFANQRGWSNGGGNNNLYAVVIGVGDFGAGNGYGTCADLQLYKNNAGWQNVGFA